MQSTRPGGNLTSLAGTPADVARSPAMPPFSPSPLAASPPIDRSATIRPDTARNARLRMVDAALDGAWRRGWAERPTLDPDELIAKATVKTGHPADAGESGWRERLALLCADLEDVATLTPLGRTIAHGQLVAALCNRIRFQALWHRHPEIAEQPIAAPIIIVGQMRSGTTRAQRLLACDPRLTFTRFFESWNPLPRNSARSRFDDRKLRGWLGTLSVRLLNPAFDAIHPTRWDAADEEIGLQSVSIFGSAFEAQWRIPGYAAAVEADDGIAAYAEFRRLLQTVAWLRRDDGTRPWILKVPQFSQDLAAVLHTFPDARLVCLSRDQHQVIASSASLVCNQMMVQSSSVDREWIGREWTRKVALRDRRTASARDRSDAPQVDLAYDDVGRDWQREISRVYRMLNMPLPESVLARMRDYVRRSRSGSHARHRYRAEDFGLAKGTAAAPSRCTVLSCGELRPCALHPA
ncbi:sulfotransferase family protein [Sphingomonas sp. IC4-52]|uniref:sulfotransferase family protein n=1 Tax=Sphingomonas sp. IC4-52 TaxID=2887202 RepID=UPI001D0FE906|nr:sulfotransferase [Sphingomonas sp. IC4-52]MCC2979523.1 sulfotransferase [Sphingomonas sp. IC4-52]